mmetsp:Transcript_55875/g.67353  ORF Transcript_55875/g.67353 Transcript_55875/m.67353 type:complete len:265 (+) Transcript_55875:58-852(+)
MKTLIECFVICLLATTTTKFTTAYGGMTILRMNGEPSTSRPGWVSSSKQSTPSRRSFFTQISGNALVSISTVAAITTTAAPQNAQAIGPVKVLLSNPVYTAGPCPPSKPIPGEKAMKGMRGLCVVVSADLKDGTPKDLEKVGVYGFVSDGVTGDSVLANNPDKNTDAGQFAMIEKVTVSDTKVEFEFVAAVPKEKDIQQYDNGIGPLLFESLRLVSFPGGQQYGAISPCEMNEFSDECDEWVRDNGKFEKGKYMVKSNSRTKGG